MRKLWTQIIAGLTNGAAVALQDHDGEVTYRVAYWNPFNELSTRRYGLLPQTRVVLNRDGTCSGVSYVKRWIEL